jgi:hypothetical protein
MNSALTVTAADADRLQESTSKQAGQRNKKSLQRSKEPGLPETET